MLRAIELMSRPKKFRKPVRVEKCGGQWWLVDGNGFPILHASSMGEAEFLEQLNRVACALNAMDYVAGDLATIHCQLQSNEAFCDCGMGATITKSVATMIERLNAYFKGGDYEPISLRG